MQEASYADSNDKTESKIASSNMGSNIPLLKTILNWFPHRGFPPYPSKCIHGTYFM